MATFQRTITATEDDGFSFANGGGIATDEIYVGYDLNENNHGFLRFQNVTISSGVTVSSATITLEITEVNGSPDTTIYGVDVDDAPAFSDPSNMPEAATRTTASVDPDPAGTGSKVIDVTTIVQEILGRGGWGSGNDMAFVIINNAGSAFNTWIAEDSETGGGNPPILDITYTAGASNNIRAAIAHQRFHNRAL